MRYNRVGLTSPKLKKRITFKERTEGKTKKIDYMNLALFGLLLVVVVLFFLL